MEEISEIDEGMISVKESEFFVRQVVSVEVVPFFQEDTLTFLSVK